MKRYIHRCPKCNTRTKDMSSPRSGGIRWCPTCQLNVWGFTYDPTTQEWGITDWYKEVISYRKGAI